MDIAEILAQLGSGKIVLIYGVAGSGKTNLVLYILKYLTEHSSNVNHYYISTEGSTFAHLLERYDLIKYNNVWFTEVINLDHLLESLLKILTRSRNVGTVVIDSVNNHYRFELFFNRRANTLLNLVLAILHIITSKNKYPSIITAQTTIDELGNVRVSGESIIKFWSDVIIKVERTEINQRVACFELPSDLRGKCISFIIGEDGVKIK